MLESETTQSFEKMLERDPKTNKILKKLRKKNTKFVPESFFREQYMSYKMSCDQAILQEMMQRILNYLTKCANEEDYPEEPSEYVEGQLSEFYEYLPPSEELVKQIMSLVPDDHEKDVATETLPPLILEYFRLVCLILFRYYDHFKNEMHNDSDLKTYMTGPDMQYFHKNVCEDIANKQFKNSHNDYEVWDKYHVWTPGVIDMLLLIINAWATGKDIAIPQKIYNIILQLQ